MIYNVLFLCTGNSARSILAEAILNKIAPNRFQAYSAGPQPKGEVNPYALMLLKMKGFDASKFESKSWDQFAQPGAPPLDFVITVCDRAAGEDCPAWPGQPMTAHWGIADPAATTGSPDKIVKAFAETYRLLNSRLTLFANLKMAGLDRLSLQKQIAGLTKSHPGVMLTAADR